MLSLRILPAIAFLGIVLIFAAVVQLIIAAARQTEVKRRVSIAFALIILAAILIQVAANISASI